MTLWSIAGHVVYSTTITTYCAQSLIGTFLTVRCNPSHNPRINLKMSGEPPDPISGVELIITNLDCKGRTSHRDGDQSLELDDTIAEVDLFLITKQVRAHTLTQLIFSEELHRNEDHICHGLYLRSPDADLQTRSQCMGNSPCKNSPSGCCAAACSFQPLGPSGQ